VRCRQELLRRHGLQEEARSPRPPSHRAPRRCLTPALPGQMVCLQTQWPRSAGWASRRPRRPVRDRLGRLSGLLVSHSKTVLYGAFVWVHRALKSEKRRFSSRAVPWEPNLGPNARQFPFIGSDPTAYIQTVEASLGLGCIVTLYHRSSTLYQIH
jgi:hypothetical protein